MSSTRTSRRGRSRALTVTALLALTAGCAGTTTGGGVTPGTALQAEGPGTTGALGFSDVKVGDVYRMAFPLTRNTSKQPVSVTGIKLLNIPAGAKVLGYSVYSVKDTPGYRLGYQETAHPTAGDVDLDKYTNYAGHPYTIGPSVLSDKYAVARIKVTGKITKPFTGCQTDYTQAGHTYHQTLTCKFGLDMA
ncbi:hypothetical protein [Streptomyces sp. NBC_00576]|uniref:hypothetical protein n=1 Tax=Streptomyces sp. NBC_00576 TaxID=2903665 RepID=UPI002E81CF93|nr:hypothetical protein [Streptomyces sp. NBC_00576]WUB73504.1 hypothetical protein OG734_27400 [Streptomyces sp. NBC_00576]